MAKITTDKLAQLLAAARATPPVENTEHAQEAVFKALLDATVYAHVPLEKSPEGVMRFVQFVRPDNGQPTDELVLALRDLFRREVMVRAAYLAEIHRGPDGADIFLLLTIVVPPAHNERLIQLTTLTIQPVTSSLTLPLSVTCISPDVSLPDLCNHGIQFYGT